MLPLEDTRLCFDTVTPQQKCGLESPCHQHLHHSSSDPQTIGVGGEKEGSEEDNTTEDLTE